MDEFLQAELEIGQAKAAGHGEKHIEELHQRRPRGAAVKRLDLSLLSLARVRRSHDGSLRRKLLPRKFPCS